jgi:glutathione-specific gamma-glutamylcyclotransferase
VVIEFKPKVKKVSLQSFNVFAYGSLIWRPDFPYVSKTKAVLHGYHRSLCIYSHEHRGTRERPGLVMGLEKGGSCIGIVYEVAEGNADKTHAYLREREMINNVYEEKWLNVQLETGLTVAALTYCVVTSHAQYTGKLSIEEKLKFILHSEGKSGKNPDYVMNTHKALLDLGIIDEELTTLSARLSS